MVVLGFVHHRGSHASHRIAAMGATRAEQRRWILCSVELPAIVSAVMIETIQQMSSDYCLNSVPMFVDATVEGNETMHRCEV